VSYSDYSLTIGSDEAPPEFYTLTVINESGVGVESLELQTAGDPDYATAGELYSLAKRKALKTDEIIENLLNEI